MPVWQYHAKNPAGKDIKGQLTASSETELAATLKSQQLTMTKAALIDLDKKDLVNWFEQIQGVPVVQKIFFTQNLAVMLRGGFSISRAMGVLALQTSSHYFQKVILTIQSEVEAGTSFSQALKKHPHVFNELFINMIAAGEVSGKLDEVLKNLTIQMKKDHQLVSKVKGALTYPIIVVITMVGAAVAMVVFVLPKLLTVFEESDTQLPIPTRVLIWVSDLIQQSGLWLALGLLGLVIALVLFGRTAKGRWTYDTILLRLPISGPIIQKINLARFTRNLSSMLSTDIPIIQSFQIISRTLSSIHYRRSMEESAQALRSGTTISKVLTRYPKLYPPLVEQMVSVGEESGTLDEVSGELAIFYEEEVDQTMSNLSTIIEPVLMVVLGVAVAYMAIAILMPMYSLSEAIT